MSTETENRRSHYIAIGSGHGWGRAKTAGMAVIQMARFDSGLPDRREYFVYHVDEATFVNEMGNLETPTGRPAPLRIRHVMNGNVVPA